MATKGKDDWSVGQIAKRAGVSVSTLHFYETKGLIKSWRNSGNQRRYSPSVLRRIGVIKSAQNLGISLKEIKRALSILPDNATPTTGDWKKLSKQWRKELDERIEKMQQLRDLLDDCIGCGCLSIKSCKLRNPGDKLGQTSSGAVILDPDD
ncbi:MAG: redox-sensitive transcriptional activator SoxR [Kangiellaceae bacterium]|nr:redox-sensitive transcriptional activator SoxR [Kangiellaceae bacterium]